MDRVNEYRQCIQAMLSEYSQVKPLNGEIEVQTIFDTDQDRYLLVDLGWDEHRRIYNCLIHLDIKDGKVWIQRNQTDRLIANALVDRGIPKQDIVIGLQPDCDRVYTGFGVA